LSNHLEDLTAEWLEYSGYFVRKSILVGPRPLGGFEGELDVVGLNPATGHLLHVECSLDADRWEKREKRFKLKFERGQQHIPALFHGLSQDRKLDQVALLMFGGGDREQVGGGRLVWVGDFIGDILEHLSTKHPAKKAVPSTLPLIRSLQLAAHRTPSRKCKHRLLIEKSASLNPSPPSNTFGDPDAKHPLEPQP
jgi:hypothetical protein